MARNSAGIVVTGLTATALAIVGVLAVQASSAKDRAEADEKAAAPRPSPSAPAETGGSTEKATALPGSSGTGKRVVYSLEADRVWLVEDGEGGGKVATTFTVTPGTVDPLPGTYTVTSRSGHVTGTDNVPVENVVRFTSVDGVTIGFSAAIDGTRPTNPPSDQKTGGIRESREDGEKMWLFAPLDTKVVVLP